MFQVTKSTYTHNRGMVYISVNNCAEMNTTAAMSYNTADSPLRHYNIVQRGNDWHFKMLTKYLDSDSSYYGAYKEGINPKVGRETFLCSLSYTFDHNLKTIKRGGINKVCNKYLLSEVNQFNKLFKPLNPYEHQYRRKSQTFFQDKKTIFGQFRDFKTGELIYFLGSWGVGKLFQNTNEFDGNNMFILLRKRFCGGRHCTTCLENIKGKGELTNPFVGCTLCQGSRRVIFDIYKGKL